MIHTLSTQVEALRRMTPSQLKQKYLELFGEPSRTGNKDFLAKRCAWRIQSLAEGGLSERARKRAMELARDADIRLTIPKQLQTPGAGGATVRTTVQRDTRVPLPGTVLTRPYKGRVVSVTVLPAGFDHDGTVYSSLSAVAKAVTGTQWNGHLFFGLKGKA